MTASAYELGKTDCSKDSAWVKQTIAQGYVALFQGKDVVDPNILHVLLYQRKSETLISVSFDKDKVCLDYVESGMVLTAPPTVFRDTLDDLLRNTLAMNK